MLKSTAAACITIGISAEKFKIFPYKYFDMTDEEFMAEELLFVHPPRAVVPKATQRHFLGIVRIAEQDLKEQFAEYARKMRVRLNQKFNIGKQLELFK